MRGEDKRAPGMGGDPRPEFGGEGTALPGISGLIDAAAQAMTRGEPSPQLRERVRGRIARRHGWWPMPVWGQTLAGAIVVVLAMVAWRDRTTVPRVPTAPPVTIAAAAAPRGGAAASSATAASAPVNATAGGRHRERPEPAERPERTERTERPESVEPPPIDPLVIDPLPEPPLIAIERPSGVMPIEIEPLRIEPLQVQ